MINSIWWNFEKSWLFS